jgi:hypothetical protein
MMRTYARFLRFLSLCTRFPCHPAFSKLRSHDSAAEGQNSNAARAACRRASAKMDVETEQIGLDVRQGRINNKGVPEQ